eukprot:TRINITY_DN2658_c0_g1_i1.p1 TRINITY_DN2658_c0_g1~~TRINITY_DN2658_c0_g1_i1.p1  ORF type:complete len:654 (+),score=83.85 TRINITY_DN2658_c0_g1_i1:391-2352(+)
MGVLSLAAGYTSPTFGGFVRLIVFECYAAIYFFFLFDIVSKPGLYMSVGCSVGGVIFLTVVNWMFSNIVLRAWYSCTGSLTSEIVVDSDAREEGIHRCEIEETHLFSPNTKCIYEGPLVNGKPHGIGTWIDTSYQGDFLRGYWSHGFPVGPFESVEHNTRNILANLRIIYGTNGGGGSWITKKPLSVGVGSIETCVSGNFFKGYPMVSHLTGPIECKKGNRYLKDLIDGKHYIHLDDEKSMTTITVNVDKRHKKLNITGFESTASSVTISLTSDRRTRDTRRPVRPAKPEIILETPEDVTINTDALDNIKSDTKAFSSEPKKKLTPHTPPPNFFKPVSPSQSRSKRGKKKGNLRLELDSEWKPVGETEALLFIHGFYHNLDDSLKRFGQFLALGHFPPYMKPFVFNWPASTNPLMFFCASSLASDNNTHRDLKKFIGMMRHAGIKTLHVMCHSMGSRFFLRSWPILRSLFARRPVLDNDSFSDYSALSSLGSYGNYGNHGPFQGNSLNPDSMVLQSLTFLNPEYELDTFLNDYIDVRMFCSQVTIYSDSRDEALKLAYSLTQQRQLGMSVFNKQDIAKEYNINLDELDVVDTGDLDRNMNDDFHGYFNINKTMVEDLYELIVTRKRAEERTSRLKLNNGIYRFTIVPSSVVQV